MRFILRYQSYVAAQECSVLLQYHTAFRYCNITRIRKSKTHAAVYCTVTFTSCTAVYVLQHSSCRLHRGASVVSSSVLQCVAVCCSICGIKQCPSCLAVWQWCILQCVAVCCSVLQCVAVCCSVLQCGAVWYCNTRLISRIAVCCSVLQCVAVCCSVLQCVAVCCSVLQCDTATRLISRILQYHTVAYVLHYESCNADRSLQCSLL